MSLLDNGPHVLKVQPMRQQADRYGPGDWAPDGEPIDVRGALQPASENETISVGRETDTRYTFITRAWPYGPHTRATFEGREYEQVGEATQYRMNSRTGHADVTLRVVGADG